MNEERIVATILNLVAGKLCLPVQLAAAYFVPRKGGLALHTENIFARSLFSSNMLSACKIPQEYFRF